LDALHTANAGKRAVVGDLEEVAAAIFDECMPAAHTVEDPIRQNLCFSRGTVRNCARDLRSRGGRCSGRSQRALSLPLEPIDSLSDTSKFRIWLGLSALDPVKATGQRGELIIGVPSRAFDVCLERG